MQDKQIIIQTDRLILRRYCKDDLRDLFEYLSDAEVIKYEPYKPMSLMEAREELDKRIANKEMIAVVLKTTNKLIGNLYLGKREFESLEKFFLKAFTEFLLNVTPVIARHGDYWKV